MREKTKGFAKYAKAHFERREIREALHHFEKALACGEDPRTHSGERWACCMLLGDFERAWLESDRSKSSFDPKNSLAGKSVLIRCLRGLGDAIQFLRYVPQLKKRCLSVTVQAPTGLFPLLERVPGIDQLVPLRYPLAPAEQEFEIECSDLPYLFRTTLPTI